MIEIGCVLCDPQSRPRYGRCPSERVSSPFLEHESKVSFLLYLSPMTALFLYLSWRIASLLYFSLMMAFLVHHSTTQVKCLILLACSPVNNSLQLMASQLIFEKIFPQYVQHHFVHKLSLRSDIVSDGMRSMMRI